MEKTNNFYSIAIDGPAGSGKSSVAKMIAHDLNWVYISTGNMFRAYAWYLNSLNINSSEQAIIANHLNDIDVILDGQNVFIKNNLNNSTLEISQEIKTPIIASYASTIATYCEVRNKLLHDQRKIASQTNVVMDGRDIGSVVLPFATLKIYLDASIEARTKRRINELLEIDANAIFNHDEIYNAIKQRDYNDMYRKIAPLVCVDDAIVINNDNLDLDQTKELIISYLKKKI